jgi:O-antigen ligase
MVLLLITIGVQAVSAFFASSTSVVSQNLINYIVEGVLFYFLILNTIRSIAILRQAIWVVLLAGSLIASLSIYQQVTQSFDNNFYGFAQVSNAAFGTGVELLAGEVYQPRLAGTIGDQNYYAQLLLMLVPLGLARVWGEHSKFMRLLAIICTALISLGVGLTFSRGAAVGFLLMLVLMALLRYIKLYQLLVIFLGLFLLLRALPQYSARLITLETVINAVSGKEGSGILAADSSTESRVTEMAAAALAFADHPLTGVGPGMFKYYYPQYAEAVGIRAQTTTRAAHNLFLDIAADTGIFGLACFLAILFLSLRNLARTRRRWLHTRPDLANMATGFILAIVTYLTTGIFLSLAYERFFWVMLALAGSTSYLAGISSQADPDPALELRRV